MEKLTTIRPNLTTEQRYDTRLQRRRIAREDISREELQKHLGALTDLAEESEPVELEIPTSRQGALHALPARIAQPKEDEAEADAEGQDADGGAEAADSSEG